jgi:hypothetical protein
MMPYLLVIALAIGAAAGWSVNGWRHAALENERIAAAAEKRRMDAKVIDRAAEGHEQDKVRIQTEFVTITQEVERVIEKPFYVASEQCLDDDGLRELNAARRPAAAASQPAPAVPGLAPSHWWQPRAEPEKPN